MTFADPSLGLCLLIREEARFLAGAGVLLLVGASSVAGMDLGSSLGGLIGFEDEKRRCRIFGRAELRCDAWAAGREHDRQGRVFLKANLLTDGTSMVILDQGNLSRVSYWS